MFLFCTGTKMPRSQLKAFKKRSLWSANLPGFCCCHDNACVWTHLRTISYVLILVKQRIGSSKLSITFLINFFLLLKFLVFYDYTIKRKIYQQDFFSNYFHQWFHFNLLTEIAQLTRRTKWLWRQNEASPWHYDLHSSVRLVSLQSRCPVFRLSVQGNAFIGRCNSQSRLAWSRDFYHTSSGHRAVFSPVCL